MDKIYEIYDTRNQVIMLATEQRLSDILMNKNHKGWSYKELSFAEAICKYGNMTLNNRLWNDIH